MKRSVVFIMMILCTVSAGSQLTIESCTQMAVKNYPLIRQGTLVANMERLNYANANLGYLPQVSVTGKGTYQSEVMQLPIKMPGVDAISKDQYLGTIEVAQTLWDGGIIKAQKKTAAASSLVDSQKLSVDMYTINERVNRLYFGILLMEAQLKQNEILQNELQTNLERFTAMISNGIATQSDLDAIRVEQLNVGQRRVELVSSLQTYRKMLSEMIGEPVQDGDTLAKPDYTTFAMNSDSVNRPETYLFDAQTALLTSQKSALVAGVFPKINLFGQWSVGRPGINPFNNDFSNWYIAGVRLNWGLNGLYSLRNNFSKIENSKASVEVQKETFLFNTKQQVLQQKGEVEKYRELVKSDDEIIRLRNRVKKAAEARVENGTISVTDLLKEITAENLAIQGKSVHEIQLMMSIYNLKNITNN